MKKVFNIFFYVMKKVRNKIIFLNQRRKYFLRRYNFFLSVTKKIHDKIFFWMMKKACHKILFNAMKRRKICKQDF